MSSAGGVAATQKSTPVDRLWPFVLGWSPFLLALLVAAAFVAMQRRMDVDEFGSVAALASDNVKRGFDWQADLVAARTHWVTALYLAIVLMLAIAGLSLRVIWKAPSGKANWIFLGLCVSAVWLSFHKYPSVAVRPFLLDEMELVQRTSSFDAEPCLLAFLWGCFRPRWRSRWPCLSCCGRLSGGEPVSRRSSSDRRRYGPSCRSRRSCSSSA